ncbi:MAG: hypothetical protein CSA34_06305 [Desulfobulbus propionicus]|nr:MAG: hypothetical protein CSA34_06305 [Desulfobulbus propionicus]
MKRKVLTAITVLVLAVIVMTGMLPLLLSSQLFQEKVLERVNASIPGSLQIRRCRVGWLAGLDCQDLRYTDLSQGVDFSARRVTNTQGLLKLLAAPKTLGTLVLDTPEVTLTKRSADQEVRAKDAPARADTDNIGSVADLPDISAKKEPFWENLALEIEVKDGRLRAKNLANELVELAGAMGMTVDLRGGVLRYDLQLLSGAAGKCTLQGKFSLPAHQDAFADTLVGDGKLVFAQLQGHPFLEVLARDDTDLTGDFRLDGGFTYRIAGFSELGLEGNLSAADIALTGGFLGDDTPRLDKIELTLNARRSSGKGWILNALELMSVPVTLNAHGNYGQQATVLETEGQVDMVSLFALLPSTLRLRADTRVTEGLINFSGEVQADAGNVEVEADTVLHGLAGSYQGETFGWNDPIRLQLQGQKNGRDIDIQRLALSSGFMDIVAKGSPAAFSLKGSADLDRLFTELSRLFTIEWRSGGTLNLTATGGRKPEGGVSFQTQLDIADCIVLHKDVQLVPAHPFSLHVQAELPELSGDSPLDFASQVQTYAGTVALDGRRLQRQNNGLSGGFKLGAAVDLERVLPLLQAQGTLPDDTVLSGKLRLDAGGSLTGPTLSLYRLDGALEGFHIQTHGIKYRDPAIRFALNRPPDQPTSPVQVHSLVIADRLADLQGKGIGLPGVNLETRSLDVHHLLLRSALAQITSCSLRVGDWSAPLSTLELESSVNANLASIAGILQQTGQLPVNVFLAGQARADTHLRQVKKGQRLETTLLLDQLTLQRDDKVVIEKQGAEMVMSAEGGLADGDVTLALGIDSAPLTGSATGVLAREQALTLEGALTPDFAELAPMITAVTGLDLNLKGRKEEPFSLLLPLDGGEMRGRGAITAELLAFQGIAVQDLHLPVELEKGVMKLAATGVVNQGDLSFIPQLYIASEPKVLLHPEQHQVLREVELTEPLVDGLLAKIHPLFGVLAEPHGKVSLRLNRLDWPLGAKNADSGVFACTFDVSQVKLDSSGPLREVLRLMKLDSEQLEFRETQFSCEGANGRITCSPIHVHVAGSEMTISGSMGLDKSMDYLLEVPVTKALVGTEGYRVLEGTTIKVPIQGTIGASLVKKKVVQAAVADVLKQAAGRTLKQQVNKALPGIFDKFINR